ncbi:hypothetical protein [Variovorax sp. Sphag1AA]|uniref:hypothetical protein n=1 Tax=Variovorax sp. Sphag1AA TaxID=2587027 RepID=UPI001616D3F6|nr:hypothetical protein [Variovorax sp. Sphag1AA]MBB3176379.1 hypothetical protein [Variovorax sp. Sphag1AA]
MKFRYNRQAIAALAIETLVPLIREHGTHHLASAVFPSHWTHEVGGFHMYLTVNVLPHPDFTSLKSVLDLYPAQGGKVFSVEFAPVQLISFHGGEWVDWLIEIACQQRPELAMASLRLNAAACTAVTRRPPDVPGATPANSLRGNSPGRS